MNGHVQDCSDFNPATSTRDTGLQIITDTISEKEGAIMVYLNIKPDLPSLPETTRLLAAASKVTSIEPVLQTKKKGLFSFR